MSMQICVLSELRLDSTSEWQQALDAESFPLQLSSDKPLAQTSGFMPVDLRAKRTGFECHRCEPTDIVDSYPEIDCDRAWNCVTSFVWGGDLNEMQAAWMAAAAYARATKGIVFDEQEGKLLSPEEAIQAAHDLEHTAPKAEAVLRYVMQQLSVKS